MSIYVKMCVCVYVHMCEIVCACVILCMCVCVCETNTVVSQVSPLEFTRPNNGGGCLHGETICMYNVSTCKP